MGDDAPASLVCLFDKVQVPSVESGDIGVSSGGKGAKDVEGLGRLVVGFHHVKGVVAAGFGREFLAVDNVSPVGRQSHSVPDLVGFRTGFGKLPGHASHLDDGQVGTKGQNQGHLQQDTVGIANVIDVELVKGFGTITTH